MKSLYWIALGVLVLAAAACWMLTGPEIPTAGGLAAKALSAGKSEERVQAAVALIMIQDPQALPQLRRLAAESRDAEVLVLAMNKLGSVNDFESFPLFLEALDHADKPAREAAYAAVLKRRGPAELESAGYRASDPPETRGPAVLRVKEMVIETDQKKSSATGKTKVTQVAAAPVENPPSKKKLESNDPVTDAPAPVTDAPAPTPSAAPAPPAPVLVAAPPPPQDNPAIQLLVWMCRVLAVLVLLAEVAGAFSLVLGDSGPSGAAKQAKTKHGSEPTVQEQVERILARNSAGLWSKITTLVAGAVCIVALLITAEVVPLISLAVRVENTAVRIENTAVRIEQKLDHSSRGR